MRCLCGFYFSAVGNKNDDPSKKQVDSHDAQRFGETVGVRVFETSAKENINVEEVVFLVVFVFLIDIFVKTIPPIIFLSSVVK